MSENIKAQTFDFTAVLKNYMLHKDKGHIKGNRIGPSEIAGECIRQSVLGRMPEAVACIEEGTISNISAATAGTALHEYFQSHIFGNCEGIKIISAEDHIESDMLNGYIDLVVEITQDGHTRPAILELKTVGQDKFDKMRQAGAPRPEYVEQITLYMGFKNIHEGYVIAINRGMFDAQTPLTRALGEIGPDRRNDMFLHFNIPWNEAAYKKLYDVKLAWKYKAIEDYRVDGIVPDIPQGYSPMRFPCFWCNFRKYCWNDAYQTVDFEDLGKPSQDELLSVYRQYMEARDKFNKAAEKVVEAERGIKKYFQDNNRGRIIAVRGNSFKIGTDGNMIYINNLEDEKSELTLSCKREKPKSAQQKYSKKGYDRAAYASIKDVPVSLNSSCKKATELADDNNLKADSADKKSAPLISKEEFIESLSASFA